MEIKMVPLTFWHRVAEAIGLAAALTKRDYDNVVSDMGLKLGKHDDPEEVPPYIFGRGAFLAAQDSPKWRQKILDEMYEKHWDAMDYAMYIWPFKTQFFMEGVWVYRGTMDIFDEARERIRQIRSKEFPGTRAHLEVKKHIEEDKNGCESLHTFLLESVISMPDVWEWWSAPADVERILKKIWLDILRGSSHDIFNTFGQK